MGLQPARARGAMPGGHRGCPRLGSCPAGMACHATFATALLTPWIQGLTAAEGGGQQAGEQVGGKGQRATGEHAERGVMKPETETSRTRQVLEPW